MKPALRFTAPLFMTLFLLLPTAGAAADADADGRAENPPALTLTLTEAVSRARDTDERLAAATLESRRAEASLRSTRADLFPSLLLGAGYERVREIDPPMQFGDSIDNRIGVHAQLRQEIFSGFRRSAQITVMEHRLRASRYHLDFVAGQVELIAVELYLNAVRATEGVHVAERALERTTRVRREMEHLLQEGLVTAGDLLRARMAEAQAKAGLARMRNAGERAVLRLKRALDIQPERPIVLLHSPGVAAHPRPDGEGATAAVARARFNRPDLLALDEEILAAEQSVRAAGAGLYPAASLVAGTRYARPSPVAIPQAAEFDYTWSVGFELTFNVGGLPRTQARMEEARLLEESLRVERGRRGADMALEIRTAALDIADAAEQQSAADLFIEQAAENLRTLESMHSEGLIRLSEVLEAQEILEQAEMNLLAATIARELAEARYRFVVHGSALP